MRSIPISLLFASLAACSHAQPPPDAPAAKAAPAPAPAPVATPPPTAPVATPAAAPVAVAPEPLYFEFDSAALSTTSEDELAKLGDLLAKHPDLKLRIEGNCDERGSEEYNIALGQHRADAAAKYLQRMGASSAQISTTSYGKSRPRATGHDEASWRQNRRDDLIPNQATLSAENR